MNPVSVDIATLLVNGGLGTLGQDIFIGTEPADVRECLTIYDTGGANQNPKFALDEATFQVRCKSANYLTGYEQLSQVKFIVEGRQPEVINDTKYLGFWTTSNIVFMARDGRCNFIWVVNFRVTREPGESSLGHRQLIEG